MRRNVQALVMSVAATLAFGAAGCVHRDPAPPLPASPGGSYGAGCLQVDRGDWLVGDQVGVWKAMSHPFQGAPVRIGYVTERHYREVRGGPLFAMWEVTALDRRQVVGTVDSLGNAKRFRPRRGGGFDTESLGNATLALSVQAVLDTTHPLTLERTSERALAFEVLDVNHDGVLDKTEFPRLRDKIGNADRNGDGKIDLQEFEAAEDY